LSFNEDNFSLYFFNAGTIMEQSLQGKKPYTEVGLHAVQAKS
jgi:hypothetical protein